MLSGLYAKLIGALFVVLALVGLFAWGHHVGARAVQAKWDTANAAQNVAAIQASESARTTEQQQSTDFAGIATGYLQATTHAYPSIADALPAAVAAGDVRLRDACPAPDRGGMSEAVAHSRALDAASTQALADRTSAAIAAVRAGGAADAREFQLGAQVTALQALLAAERE